MQIKYYLNALQVQTKKRSEGVRNFETFIIKNFLNLLVELGFQLADWASNINRFHSPTAVF